MFFIYLSELSRWAKAMEHSGLVSLSCCVCMKYWTSCESVPCTLINSDLSVTFSETYQVHCRDIAVWTICMLPQRFGQIIGIVLVLDTLSPAPASTLSSCDVGQLHSRPSCHQHGCVQYPWLHRACEFRTSSRPDGYTCQERVIPRWDLLFGYERSNGFTIYH